MPVKKFVTFDDAYGWLNHLEDKSQLSDPVEQIVLQMKKDLEAVLKKSPHNQDFSRVYNLITLSIEVSESLGAVSGSLAKAETYLECACACYKMSDINRSIIEYRKAIGFYFGVHEHNEAVARWLTGCAFWKRANQREAIVEWEMSCHLFKRIKDETQEIKWYDDRLSEMCATLNDSIKNGHWPF
jgi:hypothetical protein